MSSIRSASSRTRMLTRRPRGACGRADPGGVPAWRRRCGRPGRASPAAPSGAPPKTAATRRPRAPPTAGAPRRPAARARASGRARARPAGLRPWPCARRSARRRRASCPTRSVTWRGCRRRRARPGATSSWIGNGMMMSRCGEHLHDVGTGAERAERNFDNVLLPCCDAVRDCRLENRPKEEREAQSHWATRPPVTPQ